MKVTREVKTAILVIGAILLFIWGYMFLRGRDLFNSYRTFYVIYDNVEGLSPSASVTLNGLVIGQVTGITFTDEVGRLKVAMQVETNFPISTTSHATLYQPSIIGGKQIAILPDLKNQEIAEDGAFLKSGVKPDMITEVGDQLKPLQAKVEATVVSADSLLHNINNILDRRTQQNLRKAIADLSSTIEQFSQTSRSVNAIVTGNKTKIEGTITSLNRTAGNFAAISDTINKANIGETVRKLEQSLANVDKIINDVQSGKGTMGKLLKDEEMYDNLTAASNELKELIRDIKLNPKRYVSISVFGRKQTPYEPTPEKDKDK